MRRQLLAASLALACLSAGSAEARPVELTILHTNDTHDHLEPVQQDGRELGGAARRATLIQGIRARTPNVLVLDAGDAFQGTPLYTAFQGEVDYKVMRQVGYDALAVGNHDLDGGIANLKKQAGWLAQPPLCANLLGPDGRPVFAPYRLIERGGLRIAVVSILGPQAFEYVDDRMRPGLTVGSPLTTLAAWVPTLRRQADLVVVLSHVGHVEEVALAEAVPGIDVIVGGHSHTLVEHPVVVRHGDRPTLVVQAGQWGAYVGRIDLAVEDHRVLRYNGRLIPVTADLVPDPAVAAILTPYIRQIAPQMNQVVGHASRTLGTDGRHHADFPLGNLVTDAMRVAAPSEIALKESGGIRCSLPAGAITRGTVTSMLPFDFHLVTGRLSGRDLQAILDTDVARLDTDDTLQVSGLEFVASGGKATRVRVGGEALVGDREYTLTTTDYLARGNGHFPSFLRLHGVTDTGRGEREAFLSYLAKHPDLTAPAGKRVSRP